MKLSQWARRHLKYQDYSLIKAIERHNKSIELGQCDNPLRVPLMDLYDLQPWPSQLIRVIEFEEYTDNKLKIARYPMHRTKEVRLFGLLLWTNRLPARLDIHGPKSTTFYLKLKKPIKK